MPQKPAKKRHDLRLDAIRMAMFPGGTYSPEEISAFETRHLSVPDANRTPAQKRSEWNERREQEQRRWRERRPYESNLTYTLRVMPESLDDTTVRLLEQQEPPAIPRHELRVLVADDAVFRRLFAEAGARRNWLQARGRKELGEQWDGHVRELFQIHEERKHGS